MPEYIDRDRALQFRLTTKLRPTEVTAVRAVVEAIAEYIKSIPAADVRPVVRAKWRLNNDGSGTCSHCGRTQNDCWDYDNCDNYCPNCGADMREESNA